MTPSRFADRCLIVASIVCLATLSSVPASAQPADPGNTVCTGPYAICASAPCRPVPAANPETGEAVDPDRAVCTCLVVWGANIGPSKVSCEDRERDAAEGRPISTYSFVLSTTHKNMTCDGGAYTDCYGRPCLVDPLDPTRATCTCHLIANEDDEPFVTTGGGCDTDTCTSTLWSAATVGSDLLANRLLAEGFGLDAPPIEWCSEN